MRTKKLFFYSVGVSLIVHLILLAGSTKIKLNVVQPLVKSANQIFKLKSIDFEIPESKPFVKRGVTYTQALKFQQPSYSKIIGFEEELVRKKISPTVEAEKTKTLKPFSVLENEFNTVEKPHIFREEKRTRKTRKELVRFSQNDAGTLSANREKEFLRKTELPEEFKEKMPGFTPSGSGFLNSLKHKIFDRFSKGYKPFVSQDTKLSNLDGYLISYLSTYKDPEDKQRYFKLVIRTGTAAESLGTFSKDVIFLIDSSLSVRSERLLKIEKGILYCLKNLNENDRFNIIAFRDTVNKFNTVSVAPTEVNMGKVNVFLKGLIATRRTDVYNALYESIRMKSSAELSCVVLFSDGYPTEGVTNPAKIISDISQKNNGRKSIFAFSSGEEVNRYLLDFISYKNKGWTEYAYSLDSIEGRVGEMYNKIKDPVLMNVRFNIKGIDPDSVFPKSLPPIYRDAEFALYGKCNDKEDFVMQLLGDSKDSANEFIVVGSLNDSDEGNKEIAKEWALNKIYYLIGLLNYGEYSEDTAREIRSLSKKFKIRTPYIYSVPAQE